jgi:drug/metabolite transporter (DMT)-like permease
MAYLIIIGAVQYGVMYLCYIESFHYLKAYEVALYTVFTPLYVVLLYSILKQSKILPYVISSLLAVLGGILMNHKYLQLPSSFIGFLLVQVSNLAFAFGQIAYKELDLREVKQHHIFGLLYIGGVIVTLIPVLLKKSVSVVNLEQLVALLYLGIVSSGLCFFLWNYGAKRTNAGNLSVFNNLKLPLAVIISVLVFGERVNMNVFIGASLIFLLALAINEIPYFKGKYKRKS